MGIIIFNIIFCFFQVGDWRCVDGNPLNYTTNWRSTHPSNYENKRCLQLGRPSKWDFVDTQCNQKWPFACEKPLKYNQSSWSRFYNRKVKEYIQTFTSFEDNANWIQTRSNNLQLKHWRWKPVPSTNYES